MTWHLLHTYEQVEVFDDPVYRQSITIYLWIRCLGGSKRYHVLASRDRGIRAYSTIHSYDEMMFVPLPPTAK